MVEPLDGLNKEDQTFLAQQEIRCRVLVDPSVFGTSGRDVFAGFSADMLPQRGIIKDVIGLGDVRGRLRSATYQ